MNEKQNTDESFEQKSGQRQRESTSPSGSAPAASYREIRARSENKRRKKTQSVGPKPQTADEEKRKASPPERKASPKQSADVQKRRQPRPSENARPVKRKSSLNSERDNDKNVKRDRKDEKGKEDEREKSPDNAKPQETQSEKKNPEKNDKKIKKKRSTKPFSVKKQKRKIIALYTSMVLVIALVAAALCLTVFFKIDSISVEGETRYSTDEIIEASGITPGTNLLLCNTDSCDDIITEKFPYIETVTVRKNLFNSVTICVEETKPAAAIETNGKFYILSAKGKIIEILDNNKYDVPLIKGAELKKTELSATIEYKLSNMNSIISDVTEAIEENKLENVSTINVTSPSNVKLSYDKRLTIILGMPEELSYKVKTAKIIIDEKLEKDSEGTVDVSMCAEGGKYSYYDPSGAPED